MQTVRTIDAAPARLSLGDVYDRRRNNFDALRFGLATAVIWSHCYALAGRPMDPVFRLTGQIDAGSLAVEAFFILSGFLITQSWDGDPHVRDFTVKRALRLVPALLAALVFGAFVVGPLASRAPLATYVSSFDTWAHFGSIALHRYLASPLLFANNPVPNQLNASLWSLRYEILCYGIVALLGSVGARWTVASALLLAAGVAGEALTSWTGVGTGVPAMLARLTACFFGGSLLYALRRRVPFSSLLALVAFLTLAAGAMLGGFRLLFPIAGSYLLLFIACWPAVPLQRFGRYGDFSYGLYVFAYPIQQSIVQWAGAFISMPAFFALAFAPSLTLAVLSWHLIEKRALARKPRRRSATAAQVRRPTEPVPAVTSSRIVMSTPKLSVVIPAYNEAVRLPPSLQRIVSHLADRIDYEILVVDDGSTDGTAAAAEAVLAPLGPRGRVLRNPENLGKGASVRRGMLAARGARVLFSDADLSAPIEELAKLDRALDDGAGVAIGSRALDRALIEQRQPFTRDLMGRVFNVVVQLCAVRGIRDTQCGFKLFAGEVVGPIFARTRIDRFGFDVEVLALAQRLGVPVAEVAVRWRNSEGSRVTLVQGARAFLDPIRVRLGLVFGRYHLRRAGRVTEGAPVRLPAAGR